MFASRYFPDRYYAPRYWAKVGDTAVPLILTFSNNTQNWLAPSLHACLAFGLFVWAAR